MTAPTEEPQPGRNHGNEPLVARPRHRARQPGLQQPWRFFAQLNQPCPHPEGTRIETTGPMRNDPDPIPVGSRGTVSGGNGSQLFVAWDNGRTLILLPEEDPYRVLDPHDEHPAPPQSAGHDRWWRP